MRRPFVLILLACLAIQGSMFVHAHREQTILTSVAFNPRSQKIEIIHQTYAHDIEHAFGAAVQREGGLDSLPAQAMVALELSKSFKLWDADDQAIPLMLVGAELEAEFFYIYQEADLSSIPDTLQVEHGMLRNYWPDMRNYLNVDYDAFIKSLIFSNDDGVKTIVFE